MKVPFLIGRIDFGSFFIYNAVNHFKNRQTLSRYAKSKNLPMPPAAVIASGIAMLLGGTSILLGVKPRWGAAALVSFLLGASPLMHDFWRADDPNQRQADLVTFTKNLALAGGALALMGMEEPWPASVPIVQHERHPLSRFAA